MEREFARGPSKRMRRVKKCSPSSRGAASITAGQSLGLGGRSHESSSEESEDEEMVGEGDFRGWFIKDKDSKLRKMINRIKTRTLSDPVMKGKIINATSGRLVRFCADTGCSVNLMPEKIAASNRLKWRESDVDEPSYKYVTNEDLTFFQNTGKIGVFGVC